MIETNSSFVGDDLLFVVVVDDDDVCVTFSNIILLSDFVRLDGGKTMVFLFIEEDASSLWFSILSFSFLLRFDNTMFPSSFDVNM